MVSAVVINAWRTEQACSLLRPFLITNPDPSVKQLRRVLSELTVQDFTFSLAKNLLKTLAIQRNMFENQLDNQPVPNPIAAERRNAEIVVEVTALHAPKDFPPYRNRPYCFNLPPLKKIWLHQSSTVNHSRVTFTSGTQHPRDTRIRKMCALCSSTNIQRASSTQCSTCKVALCTTRIKGKKKRIISFRTLLLSSAIPPRATPLLSRGDLAVATTRIHYRIPVHREEKPADAEKTLLIKVRGTRTGRRTPK
jgi:hypothetical protein